MKLPILEWNNQRKKKRYLFHRVLVIVAAMFWTATSEWHHQLISSCICCPLLQNSFSVKLFSGCLLLGIVIGLIHAKVRSEDLFNDAKILIYQSELCLVVKDLKMIRVESLLWIAYILMRWPFVITWYVTNVNINRWCQKWCFKC